MNTTTTIHLHDHGITAEVREGVNDPQTIWVALDSPKGGSFTFFVNHVGDALAISVAFADLAQRLQAKRVARKVEPAGLEYTRGGRASGSTPC